MIGPYVSGENEYILVIKLNKFHTCAQYICDGTISEICHYLLYLSITFTTLFMTIIFYMLIYSV
jgi:hypothetical protein